MLSGLLKRLRHTPPWPDPAPAAPITVIGDIHGRLDLLTKALAAPRHKTILVGDYIDRGEDSAGVLRTLMTCDDLICLIGNHEEMLLNFLGDPARHGAQWLRYGGLQTLASFGITGARETSDAAAFVATRDALMVQMGEAMITWLTTRPNLWQAGNVVVAHAGADPARPLSDQDIATLRWGHPEFEKTDREDQIWVVHGHTIVAEPTKTRGRINTDTGAYATGRLTAAHISDQGVTFDIFT